MDTKKYIEYFNYGYNLAKNDPKMLDILLKSTKKVLELHEPLKAGEQEYKKEKVHERLQRLAKRGKERGRDGGREM